MTTGGPTDTEAVKSVAKELRDYATHFTERDWCYTRDCGDLHSIRYDCDFDRLTSRVKRAIRYLFGRSRLGLPVSRWAMIRVSLERDRHLPDGVLDNGAIITFWEETGEYLQYVQPTVGEMIADWLDAEPENPHAIRIAGEMRRIQDAYTARLATSQDEQTR